MHELGLFGKDTRVQHANITPTHLAANTGDQQVTLTWRSGPAPAGYLVRWRPVDTATWSYRHSTRSVTVLDQLTNGQPYDVGVQTSAHNGTPDSSWTIATVTPGT